HSRRVSRRAARRPLADCRGRGHSLDRPASAQGTLEGGPSEAPRATLTDTAWAAPRRTAVRSDIPGDTGADTTPATLGSLLSGSRPRAGSRAELGLSCASRRVPNSDLLDQLASA